MFRLTAITVSTVLALGIAELTARWLDLAPHVQAISLSDPASPYRRSENPILRYELRPGFRTQLTAQHQYLRTRPQDFTLNSSSATTGTVTINSHGLRDRERPVRKPDGCQRIVLLGDSVVELVNYVDDSQTINRLLEAKFTDGTEVLNVATAGYCTRAEAELLKERGLIFHPDTVIVVFVENDYWGYNLEHAIGSRPTHRPAIVRRLFTDSSLFRAASLKLNLFGYADEYDPAEWHRRAIGDNNVVSGFQVLKTLSDAHEFDVIVAFWPSFLKDEIGYRYVLPQTNALVAEPIAWHFGFRTVRLDRFFRDHWKSLVPQPQPEWYYTCGDGMHPSPAGCQVAADAFFRILQSEQSTDLLTSPPHPTDLEKQFQIAVAATRSLALEPEQKMPLHQEVAMVLLRQNRAVEAEQFASRAEGSSPDKLPEILSRKTDVARTYLQAARGFVSQNQWYAARDLLERVTALAPGDVDARLLLADVYQQLQLPDQAAEMLQQVLDLDPHNAQAVEKLRQLRR